MTGWGNTARRIAARVERQTTLRRHRFPALTKFDIINRLGAVNGYVSYLELSTPTTGNKFRRVSPDIYPVRRRVVYRAAAQSAEYETDTMSGALDSRDGVAASMSPGETTDLIFVDPYHSRSTSLIDLEQGLELLGPGGAMVVHDCLPTRESMAGADFVEGEWVGQTYLGFLDFVAAHNELDYCVVDTHWGVGIVWRRADDGPARRSQLPTAIDVAALDYDHWSVYRRERRRLMRVIPARRFESVFGSG